MKVEETECFETSAHKIQTQVYHSKQRIQLLLLHRALWNLYIAQSPTNDLFIKLGKGYVNMKIHIIIAPICFGL